MKPEFRDSAAIVGVGTTSYYRRGQSAPQSRMELAFNAILNALDDAGLTIDDVDGLTQYTDGGRLDGSVIAEMLGIPEIHFSSAVTGGGGGSAGSVGLAALAVFSGAAKVVVSFHVSQFAANSGPSTFDASQGTRATSWHDFTRSAGLISTGPMFAMIVQRHMHEFGTKREHFAEVALSSRANALWLDDSLMRKPMTMDDYMAAPIMATPFCLFDYCMQSDGAVAVVTTSAERAVDLRRKPVLISAASQGGLGAWGEGEEWLQMPADLFPSAGFSSVAADLYRSAGLGPNDVDVAELYDHFTGMLLLQLEDLGLAPRGESGEFVKSGGIRWPGGTTPVNTDGGSLSHANVNGMTHIAEAVRQLRGEAVNQVENAEVAIVTGAPGKMMLSGLILKKGR